MKRGDITAWLITLALFWWFGSLIAKGIDAANGVKVRSDSREEERQRIFRYRLYVAAWPYYQDLEKQAIQKWVEKGFTRNPFETPDVFEAFQKEVFGWSIQQRAIQLAFRYLKNEGFPVYKPNPNRNSQRSMYEQFVEARPYDDVDFGELLSLSYKCVFCIPHLDNFYSYYIADQVDSEKLSRFIPPIVESGVGYYTYQGCQYKRYGFPSDYEERCRLYRIQHPESLANPADNPTQTTTGGVFRKCPCCLTQHNVQTIRKKEAVEYEGAQIAYWATYLYCDKTDSCCETNTEALLNEQAKKGAYMQTICAIQNNQIDQPT